MKIILCLIIVFILALNSAYSKRFQYSNQPSHNSRAKKSEQLSELANVKHKKSLTSSTASERESQILHNNVEIKGDGSYHYDFETSNGIKRTEQGTVDGTMHGTSSYISPEGIEIKTTYVADETGYHPVGDHIPQVPDYIIRALEYIRNHPYIEKDYYTGEVKEPLLINDKPLTSSISTKRSAKSKSNKNTKKSSHNSKYNLRY